MRAYEEEAASLLDSLSKQFPHRERFLQSAFAAHERKDFPCSVPLFLAQADGICVEMVGEQLYRRRGDGTPRLAAVLDRMEERFLVTALVGPLIEPTPLSASKQERARLPGDILNRHAILHGESTTYDTRRNSCRAMSLLVYVAWVLEDFSEFEGV